MTRQLLGKWGEALPGVWLGMVGYGQVLSEPHPELLNSPGRIWSLEVLGYEGNNPMGNPAVCPASTMLMGITDIIANTPIKMNENENVN